MEFMPNVGQWFAIAGILTTIMIGFHSVISRIQHSMGLILGVLSLSVKTIKNGFITVVSKFL